MSKMLEDLAEVVHGLDDPDNWKAQRDFIRTHHATITDMAKRLEAAERDAASYRAKVLDYADRLERGEPWMHKGAKFTKWIKEVVIDMREWTEGVG